MSLAASSVNPTANIGTVPNRRRRSTPEPCHASGPGDAEPGRSTLMRGGSAHAVNIQMLWSKKNVSCEGAHQRDREPMTAAASSMSLSQGQRDREARSMPGRSEALVATDRPARYGKQLVAHLSRHRAGHWSDSDQR